MALKFCMRIVCMYLDNIYSCFWGQLENLGFYRIFLINQNFDIGVQNSKMPKSEIAILWSGQVYAVLCFSVVSYFKTVHSSGLETFVVFLPIMAKNDVTKTQLSKK